MQPIAIEYQSRSAKKNLNAGHTSSRLTRLHQRLIHDEERFFFNTRSDTDIAERRRREAPSTAYTVS